MLSAASEPGRSASSTHVPRETHMMPICVMRGSAWRQAARTATRDTSSAGERVCAQLWLLPAPRRAMERLAHLTDGESASAKYATCSPGPLATSSTRAPSWTWCFNCCSIGVRFRPKAGEAGRRRCIGGSRSGADRPGRHDGDGEDDGRRVVAAAARRSEQARMLVTRRRGGAHEPIRRRSKPPGGPGAYLRVWASDRGHRRFIRHEEAQLVRICGVENPRLIPGSAKRDVARKIVQDSTRRATSEPRARAPPRAASCRRGARRPPATTAWRARRRRRCRARAWRATRRGTSARCGGSSRATRRSRTQRATAAGVCGGRGYLGTMHARACDCRPGFRRGEAGIGGKKHDGQKRPLCTKSGEASPLLAAVGCALAPGVGGGGGGAGGSERRPPASAAGMAWREAPLFLVSAWAWYEFFEARVGGRGGSACAWRGVRGGAGVVVQAVRVAGCAWPSRPNGRVKPLGRR